VPPATNPYFKISDAELFLGDCVESLNALPASSVDLIFADPPYNLSNDGYTVHSGNRVSVNKGEWDRSRGVEEDFLFHMAWIEACRWESLWRRLEAQRAQISA